VCGDNNDSSVNIMVNIDSQVAADAKRLGIDIQDAVEKLLHQLLEHHSS